MLIVISGLPGIGKTTLAAALARRMRTTHLSVDTVEDALLGAGFAPGWTTGVAAYEAVRVAAEQNLSLGHTVVVDAVNDTDAARQTWRDAATATRNVVRFVLLRPPPPDEHQRRLRGRKRALLFRSRHGSRSSSGRRRMRNGRIPRFNCPPMNLRNDFWNNWNTRSDSTDSAECRRGRVTFRRRRPACGSVVAH